MNSLIITNLFSIGIDSKSWHSSLLICRQSSLFSSLSPSPYLSLCVFACQEAKAARWEELILSPSFISHSQTKYDYSNNNKMCSKNNQKRIPCEYFQERCHLIPSVENDVQVDFDDQLCHFNWRFTIFFSFAHTAQCSFSTCNNKFTAQITLLISIILSKSPPPFSLSPFLCLFLVYSVSACWAAHTQHTLIVGLICQRFCTMLSLLQSSSGFNNSVFSSSIVKLRISFSAFLPHLSAK